MEFTLYLSGAVSSLVILPRPERIIMDMITVPPNGLLLYPENLLRRKQSMNLR